MVRIVFLLVFIVLSCNDNKYHEQVNLMKGDIDKLTLQLSEAEKTISITDKRHQEMNIISFINPKISYNDAKEIIDSLEEMEKKYNIDKDIILAICSIESGLKKDIKSLTGDYGLCQINKKTYKMFVKKGVIEDNWNQIFDIKYNISISAMILSMNKEAIDKKFKYYTDNTRLIMLIISYNKGFEKLQEVKLSDNYIVMFERQRTRIDRFREN